VIFVVFITVRKISRRKPRMPKDPPKQEDSAE